ncbi:hypothetical protein BH10ACI1_BH10ACI1_35370 [soil metagenome]
MSWIQQLGNAGAEQVKAAMELQRNLQMNAESKVIEEQGRLKQTNIYNEAQDLAMRGTKDVFTPTAEARKAMSDAHFERLQQQIVRNMCEVQREFLGQASEFVASQGPTLPAAFATGTSAAMSLSRMGRFGARSGGFASGGLIISVAAVGALCYIIAVFAMALSRVAKENQKLREELEAARDKALLEWESQHKLPKPAARKPFTMPNRPRVAR